jgi:hypothetical protein
MNLNRNSIAAIFAGSVFAILIGAPARADENTYFGQPLPSQGLLNKMFSPKSLGVADPAGGAGGQPAGANGQVAGANGKTVGGSPSEDDDDGNGAFPKRYLLNRLFDGK